MLRICLSSVFAVALVLTVGLSGAPRSALGETEAAAEDGAKVAAPLPRLPDEIVAAWRAAGARVGWMGLDDRGELTFTYKPHLARADWVPAFQMRRFRPQRFHDLPVPEQGFGLTMFYLKITDRGWEKLASMNTLQALEITLCDENDERLKRLAALERLQWFKMQWSDMTDVAPLAACRELQWLDISHARDYRGLEDFAFLERLQSLRISSWDIGDSELAMIAGVIPLRDLDLSRTKVTDAGLHALTLLENLQSVNLCGSRVTDAGLDVLASLENLQKVNLYSTKVTREGVRRLQAKRPRLHILAPEFPEEDRRLAPGAVARAIATLENGVAMAGFVAAEGASRLANEGASLIAGPWERAFFPPLPNDLVRAWERKHGLPIWMGADGSMYLTYKFRPRQIRNAPEWSQWVPALRANRYSAKVFEKLPMPDRPFGIDLSYELAVVDADLKTWQAIPNMEFLTALNLSGTPVTGAGIAELAAMERLGMLSLNSTWVADADVKELAALKKLLSLDLGKTDVTDLGLAELAQLTDLRALNLTDTLITDAGLKKLAPLARLQALGLSRTEVGDAGLESLAAFQDLRKLDLDDTSVTDAGLKHLARLSRLERLSLQKTSITDAELAELSALTKLRELNLADTQVTDAGLEKLAALERLETLYIYHTAVTEAGARRLREKLPHVSIIR